MVYNSIEIEPSQEPSPEKPSAETIVATNYFFQSNEVLVRECAQDRQTFKSSCFTDFDPKNSGPILQRLHWRFDGVKGQLMEAMANYTNSLERILYILDDQEDQLESNKLI